MRKIKIKYVDFWPGFKPEDDLIFEILADLPDYNVEICDQPDYIIYSCFGYEHLKYDCIKIFFTGEELCPDFNICDYGIGFEYLSFEDRYFRLPLMYIPRYRHYYELMMKRPKHADFSRDFCSFVYSNIDANPIRKDFFNALSEYKHIASGGKVYNNIGGPVLEKLKFESNYKFSIAFENTCHRGYITEKLMQAFAAGGIPIYWGDPYVGRMFNENAFINVGCYQNIEDAIEYIKKIDNDNNLYMKILSEKPVLNDYLLESIKLQFERFIRNIFEQDLDAAKRTTREAYNKKYTNEKRQKEMVYNIIKPARKTGWIIKKCLKKR